MIIGLTGSIATGKSTVSRMLKNKGFPIVDADEIARLVVEPGSAVLKEIAAVFGEDVICPDGTLDREKLGARIFTNEEDRGKLNAIMHPAVRSEMIRQKQQWLDEGAKTVVMDIPLLFESKLQSYVDKIIVISAKPAIQRERLIARNNLSESEADARIASQIPVSEKEKQADAVIHNDGSLLETEKQLDSILFGWNVKL
ncbi:dephospho-CoA kinase [Sporosarcina sp. Sa2YVA2]|uniref:Dephospho-CoA kinase n=1 Tax=Sporosarcina quadrami TaxID=2762234 RepID=A0ABR8U8A1_9BACL|nr:dephospho-CoA kinase [Sporosarcina quadrami]MBD7984266.1 dephospho-CoA kinase [Sporosarcina quadrami]